MPYVIDKHIVTTEESELIACLRSMIEQAAIRAVVIEGYVDEDQVEGMIEDCISETEVETLIENFIDEDDITDMIGRAITSYHDGMVAPLLEGHVPWYRRLFNWVGRWDIWG